MPKKDNIKIFFDEVYSNPPIKNYPTNKIIYNHIDEIWSIDLADMVDHKILNNKSFSCIFVTTDSFGKKFWCIPLKNKNNQTITCFFKYSNNNKKTSC